MNNKPTIISKDLDTEVAFLDTPRHCQDVLIVYGKTDLPKKMSETQFIYSTVKVQCKELGERLQ